MPGTSGSRMDPGWLNNILGIEMTFGEAKSCMVMAYNHNFILWMPIQLEVYLWMW